MRKLISRVAVFAFLIVQCPALKAQPDIAVVATLTADSLASGSYKDVLSSFFRLAFKNLTGPQKEFILSANLFAIMLRNNPALVIDTNYKKYTAARNFNFDLAAKLDSGNKFNGIRLGLKYALFNGRDITVADDFIPMLKERIKPYDNLYVAVISEIAREYGSQSFVKRQLNHDIDDYFNNPANVTFSSLNDTLQAVIKKCSKQKNCLNLVAIPGYKTLNIQQNKNILYKEIEKSFQNKLLIITFLNVTSYTDEFRLSNLDLGLEALKGVIDPNASTNLEFDVKSSLGFGNDNTNIVRNLSRTIFNGDFGVNWVFKGWNGNQPFLELKASGSEQYIVSGKYAGEDKSLFTLNSTIRIRISNDISIPLLFKYDPQTANVFGYFNITSNFTWLGNLTQK